MLEARSYHMEKGLFRVYGLKAHLLNFVKATPYASHVTPGTLLLLINLRAVKIGMSKP